MTEIRVPTLGESVTEATIGKWFKKPGDPVAADEPLVEIVDILSAAAQEPQIFDPLDRASDESIYTSHGRALDLPSWRRVGKGATRESACAVPTRAAFGTRGHGAARNARSRLCPPYDPDEHCSHSSSGSRERISMPNPASPT